jgi:hypothetical protein
MEISLRRHRLIDRFRSTRPTSTERAGWSVGEPNSPPSYRPAAVAAVAELDRQETSEDVGTDPLPA